MVRANGSSNEEFVRDCYEALLLRTPSAGEVAAWLGDTDPDTGRARWSRREAMMRFFECREFGDLARDLFPGEEYRGDPTRNMPYLMR